MANTAQLLKPVEDGPGKRFRRSGPVARPGDALVPWTGEIPLRLADYLNGVSPWDRRALAGVVGRFAEVRELVNSVRLLHHVLDRGPHRAASGRWSFDDLLAFKEEILKSVRGLHQEIRRAALKSGTFINSPGERHSRDGGRGPRRA